MIEEVALRFGATPESDPLTFKASAVTVFVGPNYSGKSKVISEIASFCENGQSVAGDVILDRLVFEPISEAQARIEIAKIQQPVRQGEIVHEGHVILGDRHRRTQVHEESLLRIMQDPSIGPTAFAGSFLRFQTLTLSGRSRIDLVNDQAGGDMMMPPQSSIQALFRDDALRTKLRSVVRKGFGTSIVIDPTHLGQLRVRLSRVDPPSAAIERGLGDESVAFHAAATPIAEASDGAKAFVGILMEIMAGDPEVLLVDEPEAFLHPALAFTLGREVARSLGETRKRMFVSTHSPSFLMGCIQSGVPINVVRLTYRDGNATARLLPSSELIKLMRNPLLRSTNVLSALFYESVVVTEADPDRAFYQEINERLLQVDRGIPNCIFLNAQNKQTIPTIVAPLRKLGIPTAAIYDVDFVKDGGGVATRFLEAAGIPTLARNSLNTARAAISVALEAADPNYKTTGGVAVLGDSDKMAAADYFDQLDNYGAFVVRGGELESWLKTFGIGGHGGNWLIPMLERLGEDPSDSSYVHPGSDDIWQFIEKIKGWLLDPERKGIPA